MKTKIIYISGSEIFNISDIRAAFEEVKTTLNLDKDTVLFGVPVDADDAGLVNTPVKQEQSQNIQSLSDTTPIQTIDPIENVIEETESNIQESDIPVKKRSRRTKIQHKEEITEPEDIKEISEEEKVVPILTVLSNNEQTSSDDTVVISEQEEQSIPEETLSIEEEKLDIEEPTDEELESNLESLLDKMPPLQEDKEEIVSDIEPSINTSTEHDEVDITLEQLANEFAENQDKIKTNNKTSVKTKISKLKNILPFRQTKHKDTEDGDLFGWAGVAANDEEFSVPGFFTSMTAKK
ncbi:MAG: hypothetical protein MJ156_00890 [Alphaproteobacteria bacterium]|nr:hypothetical protein [Alphaproteobacteria bacterium]